MRQYRKVCSETRSRISSEITLKVALITAHNASITTSEEVLKISRAAHAARVNVSQKTRKASALAHDQRNGEDQFRRPSPLQTLQFQVAEGSQQPIQLNRNAKHRRRRRARRQQIEDSAETIWSADLEHEVHTCVSFKQREDRISIPERESRVPQQREVRQT